MSRVVERLREQFPEVPADAIDAVVNGHNEVFDGRADVARLELVATALT